MRIAVAAWLATIALNAAAADPPKADWPTKDSQEAAVIRGKLVFGNYCVLCHGIAADGNGRAAKLYDPKPANLVTSDKNAQYKELIIRRGGKALARSEFMPPWEKELTDEQIRDVILYLQSISRAPNAK